MQDDNPQVWRVGYRYITVSLAGSTLSFAQYAPSWLGSQGKQKQSNLSVPLVLLGVVLLVIGGNVKITPDVICHKTAFADGINCHGQRSQVYR